MKKLIIAVTLLLSVSSAIDPLFLYMGIQSDKALHGAFSYMATDIMEDDWGFEWWQSALGLFALGVVKESVDVVAGGKFDVEDIGANFVGYGMKRLVDFEWEFNIPGL